MSEPILIKTNYTENDLSSYDLSYGCLRPCIRKTSKVTSASTRIFLGALLGAILGGVLAVTLEPLSHCASPGEDLHTRIKELYDNVITGAKLGASLGAYMTFSNEIL